MRAAAETDELRIRIVGFLDEFYLDACPVSRFARVADEPARLDDDKTDALVGAIGEHLCHRWALGDPPAWVERDFRFLSDPWYMCGDHMRRFMFVESPLAFRRRFIFTEAEPLRRARMPRDGRFWHYEEMRSGLRPGPGEVAPPSMRRARV